MGQDAHKRGIIQQHGPRMSEETPRLRQSKVCLHAEGMKEGTMVTEDIKGVQAKVTSKEAMGDIRS